MARARKPSNGRLEEAIALLLQNQAAFLARASETDRVLAETQRSMDATQRRIDERFARIEALLLEHNRILQALPERIREKIGVTVPPQTLAASRHATQNQ